MPKFFNKPTRDDFILFSPPSIGPEEEKEVIDTLRSGWITTGPKTRLFQEKFAEYIGAKFAVPTFSCTDAMHLSVVAAGIDEGDEVITSPFTFPSTAHVICYRKAKPVFVDVERDTFNIGPEKIAERINKKTKAILPVHYGGHPCEMDGIMALAKSNNLTVIEDAAHAVGSKYKGRNIGTIGDYTCFSFYATKNLTTAEGGMITLNDEGIAQMLKMLTMYGISDARDIWHKRYSQDASSIHWDVPLLGYKCNMTDLQAALGIHQLEKLDSFIATRTEYAEIYTQAFKDNELIFVLKVRENVTHARHLYPVLLNIDELKMDRDMFIMELKELKVATSVLFKPLHLHSYYKNTFGYKYGDFPSAEYIFERIVNLPVSPSITKEQIEYVAEAVLYLLKKHRK